MNSRRFFHLVSVGLARALRAFGVGAVASCAGAASSAPAAPPAIAPVGSTTSASSASPPSAAAVPPGPTPEQARAFVDDVERNLRRLWVARDRASWTNETYITDDTEAMAAAGEDATAAYVGDAILRARVFDPIRGQLAPDVARKLYLLSVAQTVPAPRDPQEREELAGIETWMTSKYGKGRYCPPAGSPLLKYVKADKTSPVDAAGRGTAAPPEPACLRLDDLSAVLRKSRDVGELVEAWRGWHSIAAPMKDRFARYVELANRGAREAGFADVGALWRSGYDMEPAAFEADVVRLWHEVEPLYDELHCYVRAKLQARYGKVRVPDHAPIPAELLGNMWAQEWGNVFDLVAPYPNERPVDVTHELEAKGWDARAMVRQGEHFFTALGFDPLPPTFWTRSLFVRPRDREVVCHASAWDVTWSGDLRIKMCIEPTGEDFVTIHHELGHDFYFQRYESLPILFQQGANDGFHEAIGDTMALSVTPEYLTAIGLRPPGSAMDSERARINQQMKMALDKVAFLPFGLLIDQWRWDVFSGKTPPADYEDAWWKLRVRLQGVSPPAPRTEADFDPGAKFHVASSTPYVRYFLARIYQFQFHRALCRAAGVAGPLDQCSIHDNKRAGDQLKGMLSLGASRPWPEAMEALDAGRTADPSALLEYFAPLHQWLDAQTRGLSCGW